MAATLVVCPECGSPVAPGRLSCQSCGTLLASVVGSMRPPLWASTGRPLPEVDEDRPLASTRRSEMPAPASPDDPAFDGAVPEGAVGGPDDSPPKPAKRGPRLPRPKVPTPSGPKPPPAKARYVRQPPPDLSLPGFDGIGPAFDPVPDRAPPILHDWVDQVAPAAAGSDAPTAAPTRSRSAKAGKTAEVASGPVAGSYLAPSATYSAPVAGRDRVAPWQAGAAIGGVSAAWPPALYPETAQAEPAGNGRHGAGRFGHSAPAAASSAASHPAATRSLSDWLIIGGAILAIVSFLLPWATDGLISDRRVDSTNAGYLANWGLANPGHLLLIALAGAVLILHLVANRVPAWFRSSVLPLLVGGILGGLAFAYYARPAGGGAGVAVLLAGAVVLVVGGVLAGRPARNAEGTSSV